MLWLHFYTVYLTFLPFKCRLVNLLIILLLFGIKFKVHDITPLREENES